MSTTSRRSLVRIAAGVVGSAALLVATAGCSGGGGGGGGSSTSTGGTLTLLQGTTPLSLDPARANAGPATQYTDLAYSSLIHWTSDNKYEPALAKSFKYIGSGNTKFEIDLRPGLKFSDGTALDAAAVKSYLEYFENANGPFSGTAKAIIGSIDTPDDTTVQLTFKQANPDAPAAFAEGGGWGSIISPKALQNASALGTTTVGAGPYKLDASQTVTGSSYTYVPNTNYYDKSAVKFDKVVVKVIANQNSQLQAVQTGQNQWMQGTAQQVNTAKGAGLTVKEALPNVYSLFISDRGGHITKALGDVRVRQALNFAVDRDAIAKLVTGTANEQILAEGITGYDSGSSTYSYDLAKAKQLLSEAGYASGFTFTALIGTYDPNTSQVAQAMAAQLAKVGVRMNIVTATTFPDFAREQGSKKYSADIESWGSTTPYSVMQQLVLPSGVVNPWHDSDSEMNTLFSKAAGQSQSDAASTWAQLSRTVTEKAWYVPMVTVETPFFSTKGIDTLGDTLPYPNPIHF